MRTAAIAMWLLVLVPLLGSAQTLDERLRVLAPGQWLRYEVPLQAGQRAPCCFDWDDRRVSAAVCRLDRRDWNTGHRDSDPLPTDADRLQVLLRRDATGVDRIRAIGSRCRIDAAGETVVEAGAIPAASSVALLERDLVERDQRERSQALSAIAHHADVAADVALERAAAPQNPDKLRRDAVFWLAEARGERGFRHVRDLLERESDDDLRRYEVFALSVSDSPAAAEELRALTRHAQAEVRGEAIFWLAQNHDAQTEAIALAMLARESSAELRDKAVFALSQLPAERAIAALRALLEGSAPRPVRKQAMFWLAQVDDDAVLPVFDRLLGDGSD
jgi:HEAT repeat protein